MIDQRLRTLHVSSHMINDLLRGANEPVRYTTAPPDLTAVGVGLSMAHPGVFIFLVWSATFDPVPDGDEPPLIEFEYMV